MPALHNLKQFKTRRRYLRTNALEGERRLWAYLRKRSFRGLKFRRQHSVGPYVLYFYCPDLHVAIEVDGGQHYTDRGRDYDLRREQFLNTCAVKVIRFTNAEVMKDIETVLFHLGCEVDRLLNK